MNCASIEAFEQGKYIGKNSLDGEKMIKLIASDIDGTLVPDGTSKIDPNMLKVVDRCLRNGIKFVGASGRQFISIARLFEPVKDDIYYISDGGGLVRDIKQVYSANAINPVNLAAMVKDVKQLDNCDIMLAGLDWSYAEDEGEMFRWVRDSYRFHIKAVGDFDKVMHEDITKLSIYKPGNCEEVVNEWFTAKWQNKYRITSAGTMWMDVVNMYSYKGNALRALQERLGITKEETMAFGDNVNDLGMLAEAGESWAIGSAREEVKAAAKHIAPPLSEYGVTTVITEYLDSIGADK